MKRSVIAMLLIVLLAVCLCVSCKDEPAGGSASAGDKWVATSDDSETVEGVTSQTNVTVTLVFDGKGGVTSTSYLNSMKMGGVEMASQLTEEQRTTTQTGTYTATEITFTYVMEGVSVTTKATYSISGNKMTVTAEGKSQTFTKK